MKVFFTTTPRFKVKYNKNIKAIFDAIESLGYELTNDYLRRVSVEDFYQFNKDEVPAYYDEVLEGLKKADVVIFETSLHSLGVGHLLEKALDSGKGVIALHLKDRFPFYLAGIKSEKLVIEEYNLKNVRQILKTAFEQIIDQMDERFTILLPPRIIDFLNQISRKEKIPRSVYIRKLIEEDMKKRKE